MQALSRPFEGFYIQTDDQESAPAVVYANSLGTDPRSWDAAMPVLPAGPRIVCFDKRSHGPSDLGDSRSAQNHAPFPQRFDTRLKGKSETLFIEEQNP